MTLDELIVRCETRFRDSGNNIVTITEWGEYINDAFMLATSFSPLWPWLEQRVETLALAAGINTVPLPANGFRVYAIHNDTDNLPLIQLDGRADYRHWFPDASENTGTPQFYRLRSNVLEVFPVPEKAITLHVDFSAPPTVTNVPPFPEQYHRMLVDGALSFAYEDDGNPELAGTHLTKFQLWLQGMANDLLGSRYDTYHGIVDSMF